MTTTETAPATDAAQQTVSGAWRTVAAREMRVKIRDRTFIASALVTLLLVVGGVVFQIYLTNAASEVSLATSSATSSATSGRDQLIARTATSMASRSGQKVQIDLVPYADDLKVQEAVRSGAVDGGLIRSDGAWTLVGKTDKNDIAATWITAAVQNIALEENAREAGTSAQELMRGGDVPYRILEPGETPDNTVRGITFLFGFLFYLASILLGTSLANSVVEEKQNRVVEIIAASIRLRDLLLGKIIGVTALSMAQMVLTCGLGIGVLAVMGKTEMLTQIADGVGWFLLFYVIGVVVLAAVFAAAGAVSTRAEDVNASATPISLFMAMVFVAGITVTGMTREVLSFLPLTSTVTMPGRILAGDASWWEPVTSLGLSGLAAVLVVAGSERIYRRALMQTGGRVSFRKAWNLEE